MQLGSVVRCSGSSTSLPAAAWCEVLTAAATTTTTARESYMQIVPAISGQVAGFSAYKTRWSVLSVVLVEVLAGVLIVCVLPIPLAAVL